MEKSDFKLSYKIFFASLGIKKLILNHCKEESLFAKRRVPPIFVCHTLFLRYSFKESNMGSSGPQDIQK